MSNPVFSVESTVSKILVCGTTVTINGPVKQTDLNKAAKDAGIRNYVVKNESGEDLFPEDFPVEGTVKIVEYNAAKRDGVFHVDTPIPTASVVSKILVCGTTVTINGPVKETDLNKAAKDAGIRNYVVKNESGEDLFPEDFPVTGVVKIVEYNAAKRDGVFHVDTPIPTASTVSKILVCGTTVTINGPVKQTDLNKAAKDAGIRNYVVKNEAGEDLFPEDFPVTGVVKIVEYNAAKRDGVFHVDTPIPTASTVSKILVCGTTVTINGPVKQTDLNKAAKDAGIRNYVVKNEAGEDLFPEDFPVTGVVKIVEYNAAKINGVFTVE